MAVHLDHLILEVRDVATSVEFYTRVLGFAHEGQQGPFAILRVNDTLTLQVVARETNGGDHLAFAMTRIEFDAVFHRIRERGIAYGDSFHSVGSQTGPGRERGSRGTGAALYFFDPDRHLLEIRHYEADASS